MEKQEIILRVGETKEIQLTNRGASGLQLLFTVSDSSVVSVSRREATTQEMAAVSRQVGSAIPAFFVTSGLKKGRAIIHFYEKPAGSRVAPDLPGQDYSVEVTE